MLGANPGADFDTAPGDVFTACSCMGFVHAPVFNASDLHSVPGQKCECPGKSRRLDGQPSSPRRSSPSQRPLMAIGAAPKAIASAASVVPSSYRPACRSCCRDNDKFNLPPLTSPHTCQDEVQYGVWVKGLTEHPLHTWLCSLTVCRTHRLMPLCCRKLHLVKVRPEWRFQASLTADFYFETLMESAGCVAATGDFT